MRVKQMAAVQDSVAPRAVPASRGEHGPRACSAKASPAGRSKGGQLKSPATMQGVAVAEARCHAIRSSSLVRSFGICLGQREPINGDDTDLKDPQSHETVEEATCIKGAPFHWRPSSTAW